VLRCPLKASETLAAEQTGSKSRNETSGKIFTGKKAKHCKCLQQHCSVDMQGQDAIFV